MSIVKYLPCGCGIDGKGGREYCLKCATKLKTDIKKPPILSDKKIVAVLNDLIASPVILKKPERAMAQAQRDSDAEYYERRIGELEAQVKQCQNVIKDLRANLQALQQLKEEG